MSPTDCNTAQEWVLTTLDAPETMDASAKLLLEAHLAGCVPCQNYMASMRNLIGSIQSINPVTAPVALTDKILARVGQQQPAVLKKSDPFKKYAPLVAAGFLLVVAASMMLPDTQQPQGQVARMNPGTFQNGPVQPDYNQMAQPNQQQGQPQQSYQPEQQDGGFNQPQQQNNYSRPQQDMNQQVAQQPMQQQQSQPENESFQGELVASSGVTEEIFSTDEQSGIYYDPLTDVVGF